MKYRRKLQETAFGEDAPTNSVGGGHVAGLGIGPMGNPGVTVRRQKKIQRRNKKDCNETVIGEDTDTDSFAGHKTFDVSPESFHRARLEKLKGKHWSKYIGGSESALDSRPIRDYANKYPTKAIILRDRRSGTMLFARRAGKK